jgi:hypothetical protein
MKVFGNPFILFMTGMYIHFAYLVIFATRKDSCLLENIFWCSNYLKVNERLLKWLITCHRSKKSQNFFESVRKITFLRHLDDLICSLSTGFAFDYLLQLHQIGLIQTIAKIMWNCFFRIAY